jgi:hypothetical protein
VANKTDRRRVERSLARGYLDSGRTFLKAAEDLATLASEDEMYGSAIALLSVHAGISHADAACIQVDEKKSTSGDHRDAVRLLREVFGNRLPDARERDLRTLVEVKDQVAYQGRHYPLDEALRLLKRAREFAKWVE